MKDVLREYVPAEATYCNPAPAAEALLAKARVLDAVYDLLTRALAEPPDGTATLVECCTLIEATRATAAPSAGSGTNP